jgi:hypothetical protein
VVLHKQALISHASPQKQRTHDVQHVLWQDELLVEIDIGIGQIDGEDRIVIANVRSQQERTRSIQQQFKARQIARVATENAVRASWLCADVGMAVEHGKAVTVFQSAAWPRGGGGSRDVERSLDDLIGGCGG